MQIGSRDFDLSGNRTYIMGILNVTPDSFSDGGRFLSSDGWSLDIKAVIEHVESMIDDGADIIDIGGESTRPGHARVSEDEERSRVLPVIDAIRKVSDIPISLDTTKVNVARAGIACGADLINDVSGLHADGLAKLIAGSKIPCVIMHDGQYFNNDTYTGAGTADESDTPQKAYVRRVRAELDECVKIADEAGISRDKIILDPGIGFGKDYRQNLSILGNLETLMEDLDLPMLLACSRKSVIGSALGDVPTDKRLEGTLVTSALATLAGIPMVRVHDVRENAAAIRMARALRTVR